MYIYIYMYIMYIYIYIYTHTHTYHSDARSHLKSRLKTNNSTTACTGI